MDTFYNKWLKFDMYEHLRGVEPPTFTLEA
jgi:hypothetical protein